ncbi:MAG: DUF4339 domain-containing protein [Verrucomicrobiales bacterium]|nr:DUF4339 domain-containing protein [Verrucomicrobiota bacterium JB025]
MSEWFYAKDGQQNGPVAKEQLVELLRNGTLTPQDMVWTSSMSDWQPAANVQELAGGGAAVAGAPEVLEPSNPYAVSEGALAGAAAVQDHQVGIGAIVPGSEPIDVIACLKRGFDLTVRNFGTVLLIGLVYFAVSFVSSVIFGLIDGMLGFGGTSQEFQSSAGSASAEFQSNGPVSTLAGGVLSVFLSLGLARAGLNIVSGKPATVGMLFGEGDKLLKAIGASILFGVAVVVGLILLVVPGIYIALRYGQFLNAIVDRDLGIMESFQYSSELTTNNRILLLLLWLLSVGVVIAGCLALGVGLLFAYPVMWLMWLVAYRWMQFGSRAVMDQPGTQIPMLAANE